MQSKFYIIFLFFFVLFSCVDDNDNFVIDKKEYKNKLEVLFCALNGNKVTMGSYTNGC